LNNATIQRQREIANQEEQKKQLQLEMKRREQELLNKIKEQQKALETMKLEKIKVIFIEPMLLTSLAKIKVMCVANELYFLNDCE